MRLNLKIIRWKNFLSTGNVWTEIHLDSHPLTLIVGKNGSGKTTFLDAVSFGLFNKSFRKINKPQLVNVITNKDCVVEVEFEINGFEIIVKRGIKPNFFEIWKDGTLVPQSPDIRDYQDAFEKYILGIDHKTFCQVVMLGSAIFTPFMALPGNLRREVIEDLLDLKIFTRMNILLKFRLNELEVKIRDLIFKKNILEHKLTLTTQHFDDIKDQAEKQIEEYNLQIENNSSQLEDNKRQMTDLNTQLDELLFEAGKYNKTKHTKLKSYESQLKLKYQQVNQEIDFFNNHEICPTCAQEIDEDIKLLTLEAKHTLAREFMDGLDKISDQLHEERMKEEEYNGTTSQIQVARNAIRDLTTSTNYLNAANRNKEAEVIKLKGRLTQKQDVVNLDELNAKVIELDRQLIELREDEAVMNYGLTMLKDTGIKSQFIKTYIPIINNLIHQTLTQLDFYIEFTLDENFKETIKSRYLDEFSYESFSEGEKARLNIAILMTWRALAKMRGSIDCNLLIFDELLDGPLDSEGLDEILKLLARLTNNQNVYIISHKEDQISDRFNRTIKFEKIRNFSKIAGG